MKRILFAALALTVLILNLTGCANHVETFEQYIREGNYADAITLYQEKVVGNEKDPAACRAMVESYLEEMLSAYSQGTITQEEFETVLTVMEKLEDHLYLVDNLEECDTVYHDVANSKADFRRAEQLQHSGQLEDALEAFSDVLPEDTENFSQARTNMESLRQQIQQAARDALVGAYERKDYPAVFLAYREALQNRHVELTAEMEEVYEAASMEYMLSVSAQAEEAFAAEKKDYNAALEVLRVARAAVTEEPDLLAELDALGEFYKSYVPVNMADMRPVQTMHYVNVGTYKSSISNDINGNSHDERGVISPTGTMAYDGRAKSDDDAYVTYNLNFAYSTFTGTIYRPYAFLSYTGEVTPGRCVVKLYGDDALLYEFSDPGDTWDVIPIEVDVSGVRNLKIVIRGCWNSTTALLAPPEWVPAICLGECTLQK